MDDDAGIHPAKGLRPPAPAIAAGPRAEDTAALGAGSWFAAAQLTMLLPFHPPADGFSKMVVTGSSMANNIRK
jgi:hypothetical protein